MGGEGRRNWQEWERKCSQDIYVTKKKKKSVFNTRKKKKELLVLLIKPVSLGTQTKTSSSLSICFIKVNGKGKINDSRARL